MHRPPVRLQRLGIRRRKDQRIPLVRSHVEPQSIELGLPALLAGIEVHDDRDDALTPRIGPFAPPRRRRVVVRGERGALGILGDDGRFEGGPGGDS